jgi:uncharacterized protein (TIGR02452 family)
MQKRSHRAQIAAETVAITRAGQYTAPSGRTVSIAESVRLAIESSTLIRPTETAALRQRAQQRLAERNCTTAFDVTNETTFAAARRLVARFGPDRVAALNFASAKNPGGGFLQGSQAQEESLARASALYACLHQHRDYYDANRSERSLLYTDHLIVSPRVPVFRDDADQLLDEPWEVTILTSPAPNAGAVATNQPRAKGRIEPTFRGRIEQVLSAAVAFDQTALVLGAWGCGVFRNDPAAVARLFAEFLLAGGSFARAFEQITFAVLDRDGRTIQPFAERFKAVSRICTR